MNKLSLVLLSIIIMILNGCGGSDGKPLTKSKKSKPAKPKVINGYTLPPEPDPKINNATLLGVDSNHNGIRDDVERWIVKTFEHSGFRNNLYLRDLFLKKAKNYQLRLSNEDPRPKEVLKLYIEEFDDIKCYPYLNDEEKQKYDELITKYDDKIFNTHERLELFFKYEKRLPKREYFNHGNKGTTLSEFVQIKKACLDEYLNYKGGK